MKYWISNPQDTSAVSASQDNKQPIDHQTNMPKFKTTLTLVSETDDEIVFQKKF